MANHIRNDKLAYNLTFTAVCAIKTPVLRPVGSTFIGENIMARKNASDRLCASGRGNVAVGNMGDPNDLPDDSHLKPENRESQWEGVTIRLAQSTRPDASTATTASE